MALICGDAKTAQLHRVVATRLLGSPGALTGFAAGIEQECAVTDTTSPASTAAATGAADLQREARLTINSLVLGCDQGVCLRGWAN